jgi:hypothetical protein
MTKCEVSPFSYGRISQRLKFIEIIGVFSGGGAARELNQPFEAVHRIPPAHEDLLVEESEIFRFELHLDLFPRNSALFECLLHSFDGHLEDRPLYRRAHVLDLHYPPPLPVEDPIGAVFRRLENVRLDSGKSPEGMKTPRSPVSATSRS